MSAPGWVHLLAADEALAEGYRHGGYLALCGEPIGASGLPDASCLDECDDEATYCSACLYVATQRNWAAGLDVGCPSGITRDNGHPTWSTSMSWYLRSLADRDTHRGNYSIVSSRLSCPEATNQGSPIRRRYKPLRWFT